MRSRSEKLSATAPARWADLALAPDPNARHAMAGFEAFFPEATWTPAPEAAAWLLAEDAPGVAHRRIIRVGPGPWPWARFGERVGRAALLAAEQGAPGPVLAGALGSAGVAFPAVDTILDAMREGRVAGPAGLPDPGPAGLGVIPGAAVLVLDPAGLRAPRRCGRYGRARAPRRRVGPWSRCAWALDPPRCRTRAVPSPPGR